MLKPYTRNKRQIDKILNDIKHEHSIHDVLEHLLTNNLSDIVYDNQECYDRKYYNLSGQGNNTRIVIRKYDNTDIIIEVFSQTGEGVIKRGNNKYITILNYSECATFSTRVIMIDINLPYTEVKRQIYDN